MIHIGDERTPAGRYDEKPSTGLSEQLAKFNMQIGRLKTGTPPRLDGTTINFCYQSCWLEMKSNNEHRLQAAFQDHHS